MFVFALLARHRSARLKEKRMKRTIRKNAGKSSFHDAELRSTPPALLSHFKELAKRSLLSPGAGTETPKCSVSRRVSRLSNNSYQVSNSRKISEVRKSSLQKIKSKSKIKSDQKSQSGQ